MSDVAGDHLVEQNLGLAWKALARMRRRVPNHVDTDELRSAALFGLLQAARSYDPTRGAKFSTHANMRIRGAMLDVLRQQDRLGRNNREKRRRVTVAREKLYHQRSRKPTWEDLVDESGVSSQDVLRVLSLQGGDRRLDDVLAVDPAGRSLTIADTLEAPRDTGSERIGEETRRLLRSLDRRQRAVVLGMYYLEMTQREVATSLRVSPSRVAQLHREALFRLGTALRDDAWRALAS